MLPSLRGEIDWWKYRSRSPLSFPSRRSKNHWRDREIGKLKRVSNGVETRALNIGFVGEEDPFK